MGIYVDVVTLYSCQPWREVTGWIVLALLLLHPGLILIDRISIPDYVGDNIRFIYLGVFALSAFLLWEAVTKLKSKFLEKYRPIWSAINDVAFIAIFFHGLNLGQHLQVGWFRTFWIITGIAAGISIIHNLVHDLKD